MTLQTVSSLSYLPVPAQQSAKTSAMDWEAERKAQTARFTRPQSASPLSIFGSGASDEAKYVTMPLSGSTSIRATEGQFFLVLPVSRAKTPDSDVVQAAKARWKSRAMREVRFVERMLGGSSDSHGLPMPPVQDGFDSDE